MCIPCSIFPLKKFLDRTTRSLNHAFSEAVGSGMIRCDKAMIDREVLDENLDDSVHILRAIVRLDDSRKPEVTEDMEECLSDRMCRVVWKCSEKNKSGEYADYYQKYIVSTR